MKIILKKKNICWMVSAAVFLKCSPMAYGMHNDENNINRETYKIKKPSDIKKKNSNLIENLENIKKVIENLKDKDIVLNVGSEQAMKNTLFPLIFGKQLPKKDHEESQGEMSAKSFTSPSRPLLADPRVYIWEKEEVCYVSYPSFLATKKIEADILKIFFMQRLVHEAKNIKIIFVTASQQLSPTHTSVLKKSNFFINFPQFDSNSEGLCFSQPEEFSKDSVHSPIEIKCFPDIKNSNFSRTSQDWMDFIQKTPCLDKNTFKKGTKLEAKEIFKEIHVGIIPKLMKELLDFHINESFAEKLQLYYDKDPNIWLYSFDSIIETLKIERPKFNIENGNTFLLKIKNWAEILNLLQGGEGGPSGRSIKKYRVWDWDVYCELNLYDQQKYGLRLMREAPTIGFKVAKSKELVLFYENNMLFCQAYSKEKFQIKKFDDDYSQGIDSKVFDRIKTNLDYLRVANLQEKSNEWKLAMFNYNLAEEGVTIEDAIALLQFISLSGYAFEEFQAIPLSSYFSNTSKSPLSSDSYAKGMAYILPTVSSLTHPYEYKLPEITPLKRAIGNTAIGVQVLMNNGPAIRELAIMANNGEGGATGKPTNPSTSDKTSTDGGEGGATGRITAPLTEGSTDTLNSSEGGDKTS